MTTTSSSNNNNNNKSVSKLARAITLTDMFFCETQLLPPLRW